MFFKVRNDLGFFVGVEVNLGGVVVEFYGDISCRVFKVCIEDSWYSY